MMRAMTHDAFGNPLTRAAPETAAAFDTYVRAWTGYGTELPVIIAAADADLDCPIAAAHAAMVHMALEAASGYATARPYLDRALTGRADASASEQAFIDATAAFAAHDIPAAVAHLERAVMHAPADICAAKWGQYHAFNLGDAAAMLRLADAILPAHAQTAEAHGMHAFALEQSHRLTEAEDAARRAIALKAAEPWAHHTLAHVMETQGRLAEGIAFLSHYAPTWEGRSIFIRHHNWWHQLLFLLDLGETPRALDIFDARLWGVWPEFAQEQIGAISALIRLELRGADVGGRWAPVAAKVAERGYEHIQPFHDLHFVYALARAGEAGAADAFLRSLAMHAARAPAFWGEVALPAAEGLAAHAQGRFDAAVEGLARALPRLQTIGGSHAQRDLFNQVWIDALWRSGSIHAARTELERRVAQRGQAAGLRALAQRVGGMAVAAN